MLMNYYQWSWAGLSVWNNWEAQACGELFRQGSSRCSGERLGEPWAEGNPSEAQGCRWSSAMLSAPLGPPAQEASPWLLRWKWGSNPLNLWPSWEWWKQNLSKNMNSRCLCHETDKWIELWEGKVNFKSFESRESPWKSLRSWILQW